MKRGRFPLVGVGLIPLHQACRGQTVGINILGRQSDAHRCVHVAGGRPPCVVLSVGGRSICSTCRVCCWEDWWKAVIIHSFRIDRGD